MSVAGGLIRELESTRYIHVGVGGDSRCIFLFDQDAPDLDVSDPSYDPTIYSTSPSTDLQDGSVANYFQPNVQGQNKAYQCSFPYKSDGTPRLDFYLYSLFSTFYSNQNYKLISGNYGNFAPSLSIYVFRATGDGLVKFGNLFIVKGTGSVGVSDSIICDLIESDKSLGRARIDYIESFFKNANTAFSNNSSGSFQTIKKCILLSGIIRFSGSSSNQQVTDNITVGTAKIDTVDSPSTILRNYYQTYTDRTAPTRPNMYNYNNLNPVLPNNINLPPEFNLIALNDFTLNIDSPHFRNGGANQSANIGNAKYGIPLYRGSADNNDDGLVSDVATGGQLANWVEGTNTFSTTVNLSVPTLFSSLKLIGAEQLTQSFDYSDYDILTGVFSSVPSLPTDYSKKNGRPVIYARITINGNTIPFTNDLPATVDGLLTANYIPLQLDSGAQYYDNYVLLDGNNNLLYTDVQTDFVPNIIGYTKKTFRDFLFSKITKNSVVSVSLIAYFHDKSEANLFQGLSVVGSQNIVRDVNLIAGTDVVSIDNVTNWQLIDDLETSNVDLVFNASTGLTIPFGFNKVYSSQGDFTITTDEGQSTFNNLNINSEAIEVVDNGDGTVTVNITIVKPTEMPIIRERTIKVVEPCENPVLIRWRNTLGGVDRWVFEWNQQDSLSVDDNNLYQENFFKIEDQETVLNYVKRTGRRQINLQAENIELQAIRGIRTVGLSDLVQLYDHVRGVWLTVTVQDTNIGAVDTKRKVGNIQFTVNLPELYTNGN